MKMKNLNELHWVVCYFVDRKTQDDRKSKIGVVAAFANPINAEDFIKSLPMAARWYIVDKNELDAFENFYNAIQDLVAEWGADYAIYHLKDLNFGVDLENRFRSMLNLWVNDDFKKFDL